MEGTLLSSVLEMESQGLVCAGQVLSVSEPPSNPCTLPF